MTTAPPEREPGWLRRLAIDTTPFRVARDFRLLWCGELVSQVGSQITLVALFVQVYRQTGSNAAVGLIGLVQLVPMAFVSIGLGPQIDLRERRRLLLIAQFGLMFASVLLFVGARMGDPPLVLVYFAAAVNAGFMSLSMPTRTAMIARIMPADLLPSAAALNQAMWNGAAVIGPALGGVVIAQLGLAWAYGIDVFSYGAALTAAFLVHSQVPIRADGTEAQRGVAAIREGLHYLKGKPVLQSTFTIDIVAMVFGMPRVVFPALAATQFHRGPEVVGWLLSAVAVGALCGALGSGWVGAIRRQGFAIIIAVTVWGSAIVAFGLVGDNLGLALVALAVAGAADVISAVFRGAIQQRVVPDELRGRLTAFNILVVAGGPRLGDLEGGVVASVFSPTVSVVAGGLLCLAGVGVISFAVPRFARWRTGDPP